MRLQPCSNQELRRPCTPHESTVLHVSHISMCVCLLEMARSAVSRLYNMSDCAFLCHYCCLYVVFILACLVVVVFFLHCGESQCSFVHYN